MFRLLLVVLLPAFALATEGIVPCSNGAPMPNKVHVDNCEKVPCILPRGDHLTSIIDFESPSYSETLTLKNTWREIASGLTGEFPFPSSIKNACNHLLNAACPVYPSEDISYNLTMPVLKLYPPKLDLDLQISVWNDDGEAAFCFNILARTSS
ncbi:uncharacterized protein LOC134833762 [Culicoides brevitarsis]|uniref:uncharacterized protein LOC134833762 n=1 Tax=Culicoides brevitarsis TaxID=469753 RepID=UPI00307BC3B4